MKSTAERTLGTYVFLGRSGTCHPAELVIVSSAELLEFFRGNEGTYFNHILSWSVAAGHVDFECPCGRCSADSKDWTGVSEVVRFMSLGTWWTWCWRCASWSNAADEFHTSVAGWFDSASPVPYIRSQKLYDRILVVLFEFACCALSSAQKA